MAYTPTSSATLNINYTARPDIVTFVGSGATSPTPNQKPDPLFLVGGLPAATTTAVGGVTKVAAPAAAPVPFADLTAAANAYNALRTALINAGIMS